MGRRNGQRDAPKDQSFKNKGKWGKENWAKVRVLKEHNELGLGYGHGHGHGAEAMLMPERDHCVCIRTALTPVMSLTVAGTFLGVYHTDEDLFDPEFFHDVLNLRVLRYSEARADPACSALFLGMPADPTPSCENCGWDASKADGCILTTTNAKVTFQVSRYISRVDVVHAGLTMAVIDDDGMRPTTYGMLAYLRYADKNSSIHQDYLTEVLIKEVFKYAGLNWNVIAGQAEKITSTLGP